MPKRWIFNILSELLFLHHSNQYSYVLKASTGTTIHQQDSFCIGEKTCGYEQIGFLRSCQREKLTPKGLRVKLPSNMGKTEFGGRLQGRSEKWVLKRRIGDLFVKVKGLDKELVGLKLHLNIEMGFSNNWIDKVLVWSKMIFETIFF